MQTAKGLSPFRGTRLKRIKSPSAVCVHRGRPTDSDRLIGGGSLGGRPNDKGPNRLIIPGQQQQRGGQQQQQQLYVPEDTSVRTPQGGQSGLVDLVGETAAPTYNKFRPPIKFMEEIFKDEDMGLSVDEMLNRLSSRAGYWHVLAKYLTPLNKAGYDSGTLDALTGLTSKEQTTWLVASTLYDSLKECGIEGANLDYFDHDGDALLWPFRFLEKDRRAAAAKYLYETQTQAQDCEVLARAMKEWERRPFERAGFSDHPADCLAFKYMRDAGEMKTMRDITTKVEAGLKVAVSETAAQRLREVLEEAKGEGKEAATCTASLVSLRLTFDEMGFRPIPVIGELGQVTAEQVTAAPKATTKGPFGAFIFPNSTANITWVALPQWKAVAMAPNPTGITVAECTTIPAVLSSINVKNKDDLRKVGGPGMLLVDQWQGAPGAALNPDKYYIVGGAGKAARMADGRTVKDGETVVAEVLFLCRPPQRENTLESQGTDLLSV